MFSQNQSFYFKNTMQLYFKTSEYFSQISGPETKVEALWEKFCQKNDGKENWKQYYKFQSGLILCKQNLIRLTLCSQSCHSGKFSNFKTDWDIKRLLKVMTIKYLYSCLAFNTQAGFSIKYEVFIDHIC